MAEEVKVTVMEEEIDEKDSNPFVETTRRVLLAGIGAMALAQEEAEAFVNKLVERGEIAEKDGRRLIKDMMERRKQKAEETVDEAEGEVDERIEQVLHRMNVPSKKDIDALGDKITALTKKVDDLKKAQK